MSEYRIVSDGLRWKIQKLHHTWLIKIPYWSYEGVVKQRYPGLPMYFDHYVYYLLDEAETKVRLLMAEDAAKARGYQVLKEYNTDLPE